MDCPYADVFKKPTLQQENLYVRLRPHAICNAEHAAAHFVKTGSIWTAPLIDSAKGKTIRRDLLQQVLELAKPTPAVADKKPTPAVADVKPTRPATALMRFTLQNQDLLKRELQIENGGKPVNFREVTKIASKKIKELDAEERNKFENKYKKKLQDYKRKLSEYERLHPSKKSRS